MTHPVPEHVPQLRRLTNKPLVRRCLAAARQNGLVTKRISFLVGEFRGGTRAYPLALNSDYSVLIRHQTQDTAVFAELFRAPMAYEPPSPVAVALGQIANRRGLRVLDLGGNIGLFALYTFVRYGGAHVTSYEPEPDNLAVLRECARLNHFARWDIIHGCATATDGVVSITPARFAHTAVASTGLEVPSVDVLPLLDRYDFVKMDIEGSEWQIIRDERWPGAMQDVTALVLEWHDRASRVAEPCAAALARLHAAGFNTWAGPDGTSHGVIWAWRSHM
jgi:FkbM family methyltransferase